MIQWCKKPEIKNDSIKSFSAEEPRGQEIVDRRSEREEFL